MNLKSKQKDDGYPPSFFFASHSSYKGRQRINNNLPSKKAKSES